MFTIIKEVIRGKKTYITGCVAIVTALVAWSMDEITAVAFVTAATIALQTMFLRAGVKKAE